ncbi:Uma2 family endonuclease [Hymenobacter gummosus]|uniref:Uma2 family endonuclease n=1 Tax=Hymenobacter gummosus TaxID=1776032 RepID=A0A431TVB2_9BACT|nr:Uma2 family endonuclease [Hymenobacter gummosus]RTQ45308.1 Uma2 family endonuclease [Hymenobacter gummosus]
MSAASLPQKNFYTPEEYLAFDRASTGKFEFMDGQIIPWGQPEQINVLNPQAMSGATFAHYRLVRNLAGLLFLRLPKSCAAYTNDARVFLPVNGSYAYPDLVVVCGEPTFTDEQFDTLTNPILLIEVLSKSTADYDRSAKLMRYFSIPSLQEYLLVDSRSREVILYSKDLESGRWYVNPLTAADETITLQSVNCAILLAELYDGLPLGETSAPEGKKGE